MYVMFNDSANKTSMALFKLKEQCVDESTGAKLDIMNGTITAVGE